MFCSKCGRQNLEGAVFCAGCGAGLTIVQPADRKHLTKIAGIFDIVAGSLAVFSTICMLLFVAGLKLLVESLGEEFEAEGGLADFVWPGVTLIGSIVAIVGGIFALRRKNRAMAFVGATAAILAFFPLGIPSMVLTVMARDEFE